MIPVDLLNYQLIRLLGRGGMGEVYLAKNKNIEQYVAVKAIHPKYANNPAIRSRFKQEAIMLNTLNHPNIVKFYNFVENEYGVFLIMEYVEGCTLEEFITKKNGLIVEEKAYPMMLEILNAFAYAHQHGIIHHDIKPSNIFLDKEGHIKVMDFGIAQIISEAGYSEGKESSMGTPAYMSPEQVFGQKLDQRSDIYSLGVLFHQMLTGRAPYDSTTMSELEIKGHVVKENLPRMKSYYPYISNGLQVVVDKATAKKPQNRYSNCEEMTKAIKNVMQPKKSNRMPLYVAAAACAISVVIGLGIWDYFRTKVSYYSDYVEFNGVAKGVGSLSGREVSHREFSYRIESSRWKVRRLTLVNSKDKPVGHTDSEHSSLRYSDTYYYYTDNGNLDYKKVYDQYGKLLYKIDYDEKLSVAMFKYDDEHGTAKRIQSSTTKSFDINANEHSSITRYLLDYDEDGLLRSIKYASGEDNTPVGDVDNIYGQMYSYDDVGHITEIKFIGQDSTIRGNKIGLAIKQFAYDEDGNWTEVKYLSANGEASHDGQNCSVVKLTYDKWGNRETEKYFTADGETPSCRTDLSAFGIKYSYDENGNRVTMSFLGSDGESFIIASNGCAQSVFKYNDDGFLVQQQWLDVNGNETEIISNNDLIGLVKFDVDEKGLELSRSFYDLDEKPIHLSWGGHKITAEYDSVGNITKVCYYDKGGKLVKYNGFYNRVDYTYDNRYLEQTMSYLDSEGKLTYSDEGFARCQYSYDNSGNITKIEYIDKDGKTLINNKYGYAVTECTYDNLGNRTSFRNYNSLRKPVMTSYGYYAKELVYEDKTNFLVQEKLYNVSGNIISIRHFTYDDNGNVISDWTTNSSGSLQGEVIHYEYDENNRYTKSYYTNLSGNKISKFGYCEKRNKYDERGNIIEQVYFDTKGNPALDENQTHKRITKYDERNNIIYEKNLGKDGKPIKGANVNIEGELRYDERGNIILLKVLDGYGKPCLGAEGYHTRERKYNEYNKVESEQYKDTKGHLVKHKYSGYAKVTFTYDDKRNCIKEKYFNAEGTMTNYITCKYNDRNAQTELCFYNASNNLDDSKNGFAKVTIKYAEDGITPQKRTFYNRYNTTLAWQIYNVQTRTWGSFQF